MKKIGLYLRVSTEEQARIQDGSLVSQRKRLEEYVEGQNRKETGWGQIIEMYCDEGRSAKDMNRPEFQRLLNDIRSRKIDIILSTELSRLSRSIKDFCELWDLFKKHNASFITLRENFDTTTAAGEMIVFNMINFAQFERKQTAERISANWLSRAKRGLWNGGCVPLGFNRNPKNPSELIADKKEAAQVKMIFELFLKTGTVRKTCFELSKKGAFSKRYTNKHGTEKGGGHFTVSSLQRILSNKAYIGIREINKSKGSCDVVKANWSAIVDLELFNQVQERLAVNKNRFKPDEWKTYAYPLTELIICGECGKHLGGKSAHGAKSKHFYYAHPRQINSDGVSHLKRCQIERVRAPRMEEIVLRSLKTLATDPKKVDHWLDIYEKGSINELPLLQGRLKTINTDIQTQSKRMENLVSRLADLPSEISAEPIYNQIKVITQKTKDLEALKEDLSNKHYQLNTQKIDRNGLLQKIQRAVNNLEKTPIDDRRAIYSNLIKFAEVHATKVRLGVYAPSGSESISKNDINRVGSTNVLFGTEE